MQILHVSQQKVEGIDMIRGQKNYYFSLRILEEVCLVWPDENSENKVCKVFHEFHIHLWDNVSL